MFEVEKAEATLTAPGNLLCGETLNPHGIRLGRLARASAGASCYFMFGDCKRLSMQRQLMSISGVWLPCRNVQALSCPLTQVFAPQGVLTACDGLEPHRVHEAAGLDVLS